MPDHVARKKEKMTRQQVGLLFRLAFWSSAIAILVLSLVPVSTSLPSTGWDKTNHLLAYAALGFLGHRAYPGHKVVVLAALLTYGGFIEVLQSFTPDRFAEWGDLLADGIGLLLGELLARLAWRRPPERV